MRKFFVFSMILLCSAVGRSQSDCNATYCGSVPLFGVSSSDTWKTDLFIAIEAEGEFWFRLRTAPEHLPHYIQNMDAGTYFVGLYDLIGRIWGEDVDFAGVVLFDYASWDPIHRVELLPMARTVDVEAGMGTRLPAFWLEPGCHQIPRPWHDGHLIAIFQFYNYDEDDFQTVRMDDGDLELALPSPVGDEEVLEIRVPALDAYVTVCLGEEPVGGPSHAGWDPDLGLYFVPLFQQFDDFIVSTVW